MRRPMAAAGDSGEQQQKGKEGAAAAVCRRRSREKRGRGWREREGIVWPKVDTLDGS
jgi:hypothetical protein